MVDGHEVEGDVVAFPTGGTRLDVIARLRSK